jgi:hypothetical protein
MGKPKTFDGKVWGKSINNGLESIHSHINALNASKIFAGFMIIVLNIASRFVTIKLSKTMESYLRHTFSRQALIFAIAWMGTRDIYIAFSITLLFSIVFDVLLNEDSQYCILSSDITEYYTNLPDSEVNQNNSGIPQLQQQNNKSVKKNRGTVSKDMVNEAKEVINTWKQQIKNDDNMFYKIKHGIENDLE